MNTNPHRLPGLTPDMIKSLESIRRLDRDGYLYEMDCLWNYWKIGPFAGVLDRFGLVKAGCSVFASNLKGAGAVTCRNYDYRHRVLNDKTKPLTGQNIIIHCAPEGKLRSVGVADAFWLDGAGGTFYNGTLDDGKTDVSAVAFLPYACMDAMNEKGLFVCILSQGVKDGEAGVCQNEPGKPKMAHTVMMRNIIDNLSTVQEAVAYARSVNIVSHNGSDYRVFMSDATGASVALEWRYNKLYVTDTDISTNFFVAFDDRQPRMKGEKIVEHDVKLEGTSREYHWGYGGGYTRFAAIAAQLEEVRKKNTPELRTELNLQRAEIILKSVTRISGVDNISCTQYNSIYDQKRLKLYLRVMPKYGKRFEIKL